MDQFVTYLEGIQLVSYRVTSCMNTKAVGPSGKLAAVLFTGRAKYICAIVDKADREKVPSFYHCFSTHSLLCLCRPSNGKGLCFPRNVL